MGAPVHHDESQKRHISKRLEDLAQQINELKVSKSEFVEAILAAYFKSPVDHKEKAKELIMSKRGGKV